MNGGCGSNLVNYQRRAAAENDFLGEHRVVSGDCLLEFVNKGRVRSARVENDDDIQRLQDLQQRVQRQNLLLAELPAQRMRVRNVQVLNVIEVRFVYLLVDLGFL